MRPVLTKLTNWRTKLDVGLNEVVVDVLGIHVYIWKNFRVVPYVAIFSRCRACSWLPDLIHYYAVIRV